MQKPIYLDFNATTPLAAEVLDAILPYLTENFGNAASRTHMYGWEASQAVEKAKASIAKSLDCKINEIVFTSGATESINLALKGSSKYYNSLITSKLEHKATLDVAEHIKDSKTVCYLENDQLGQLSMADIETKAEAEPNLFSLLFANNETGIILPIPQICAAIKKKNSNHLIHIDATQAVGKIPVSFKNLDIDMMSLSGHKIYGPKGIGLLIVKEGIKLEAQIHGGGHQRGHRSGTLNVPAIVGLAKALELSTNYIEIYGSKISLLRDKLEQSLLQIPGCQSNNYGVERLPNTCHVSFKGIDGESLIDSLSAIAVSNGSACTSANVEPSHVLKAMHFDNDLAMASLRISLGIHTTESEIDQTIIHITQKINQLS